MRKLNKIIKETEEWLKQKGYDPSVARIHLEALESRNSLLKAKLLRELNSLINTKEASPNGEPLSSPQQAEGYPAEG